MTSTSAALRAALEYRRVVVQSMGVTPITGNFFASSGQISCEQVTNEPVQEELKGKFEYVPLEHSNTSVQCRYRRPKMPACRILIAAVLLSSPAFPAAPMPRSESISLETVTVIATRTVRSLDELASTVSVKTADDLERELARDISDLVRFEPGVTVAGAGSRFGLTGFNIRGIGGNRVLTMIDGIRVPEEFSFGPFLSARRDYVDIDSLSRAEIARGPVSSLYGSDALGGVVALTTRQPSDYLDADRTFSGSFKGGHSGVDKNTAGTVSLAARSGPASGLILYTRRTGPGNRQCRFGRRPRSRARAARPPGHQCRQHHRETRIRTFGQPGIYPGRGPLPQRGRHADSVGLRQHRSSGPR